MTSDKSSFEITHPVAAVQRIDFLDPLRTFATLQVLILHIVAQAAYSYTIIPHHAWFFADCIDSFCRDAVPLFILISGTTLLAEDKTRQIGHFFARRFRKVGVAFIAWSVFYLAYQNDWHVSQIHFLQILTGPGFYHIVFVYQLLGLYLAAPVLAPFADRATTPQKWFFAALWFGYALFAVSAHYQQIDIGITNYAFVPYIGYFVIGRWLGKVTVSGRLAWMAALAVLVSGIFTALMVRHDTLRHAGILDETLYEYGRPNTMVLAIGLYLLFRSPVAVSLYNKRGWLVRVATWFAPLSLGVYLVHPFILAKLAALPDGYALTYATIRPLIGIPLTLTATLACSSVIILLLRSNRLTRWLSP